MTDKIRAIITTQYKLAMCGNTSRLQYHNRANRLLKEYDKVHKALHDLVRDLKMRSKNGVVDCGNGVYMGAKEALGELK